MNYYPNVTSIDGNGSLNRNHEVKTRFKSQTGVEERRENVFERLEGLHRTHPSFQYDSLPSQKRKSEDATRTVVMEQRACEDNEYSYNRGFSAKNRNLLQENYKHSVDPGMIQADEKSKEYLVRLEGIHKTHPEFQYNGGQARKHTAKIILPPLLTADKIDAYKNFNLKKLNHHETSAFTEVKARQPRVQNQQQSSMDEERTLYLPGSTGEYSTYTSQNDVEERDAAVFKNFLAPEIVKNHDERKLYESETSEDKRYVSVVSPAGTIKSQVSSSICGRQPGHALKHHEFVIPHRINDTRYGQVDHAANIHVKQEIISRPERNRGTSCSYTSSGDSTSTSSQRSTRPGTEFEVIAADRIRVVDKNNNEHNIKTYMLPVQTKPFERSWSIDNVDQQHLPKFGNLENNELSHSSGRINVTLNNRSNEDRRRMSLPSYQLSQYRPQRAHNRPLFQPNTRKPRYEEQTAEVIMEELSEEEDEEHETQERWLHRDEGVKLTTLRQNKPHKVVVRLPSNASSKNVDVRSRVSDRSAVTSRSESAIPSVLDSEVLDLFVRIGNSPLPLPKSCKKHSRQLSSEFDFITFVQLWKPPDGAYGLNIHLGLCDDRRHYTHIIREVLEGSVATRAGIEPGDCILAVNNLNVEKLNHEQLMNLMQAFPLKVKLHVIRGWAYKEYAEACHPCNTCRQKGGKAKIANKSKVSFEKRMQQSIVSSTGNKSKQEEAEFGPLNSDEDEDWSYVGAPKPLRPTFDCPICLQRISHEKGHRVNNCQHHFCRSCLVSRIKNIYDGVVKCPFQECTEEITQQQLVKLLTYEELELFLAVSLRLAEKRKQSIFHCQTPECPAFCAIKPGVLKFTCPVCQQENCLKCKGIHPGGSCNQFGFRRGRKSMDTSTGTQKLLSYKESRRCPGCGNIVIKLKETNNHNCTNCKRTFQ